MTEFLKMEGIWSESEEGEEYYQMMKHRNNGTRKNTLYHDVTVPTERWKTP